MSVGIDSMVLIYAGVVPVLGKSKTSKQFDELRVRARMLLDTLANDKVDIVLSAVSISELLVPVPLENHGKLLAELSKHFICQPHDLHAASIAAQLWSQAKNLPDKQKYTERHVLKADVMIIAGAKAGGATYFYSHDLTRSLVIVSFRLFRIARPLPRRKQRQRLRAAYHGFLVSLPNLVFRKRWDDLTLCAARDADRG